MPSAGERQRRRQLAAWQMRRRVNLPRRAEGFRVLERRSSPQKSAATILNNRSGLEGFLRRQGILKSGRILLSVHCDSSDETKKAKELLEKAGATDVSSASEAAVDTKKTA